ncbi:DUF5666 domain-containing protein [Psychrobium sp. 1_MG-2023]|uniref:DUF5666 domain-containing protein n=1 Tax=Psychrobium sp. 1_MG-2023 TaxID=3062624 RepID=UPI0027326830|nr:DUF5666 domain-containing protein [Psychrobium sp. 1_MG-2023]MDP2559799.1 DUF5666 domain-containing protein [Psychrobium sp. 1_MG-2023]
MKKYSKKYLSLVTAGSLLLTACGGGSDSDNNPTEPEKGSLSIAISGLPTNTLANIEISGPDSFKQVITATTTIPELAPGTYTIKALEVSNDSLRFITAEAGTTIDVRSNQTTQELIQYGVPQISQGVVSGFGSVYVNGTRYDTSESKFTHNHQASAEASLNVGMQVTVTSLKADDNTSPMATSIEYLAHAQGGVTHIDLFNNSFVILGQTYIANELTVFEDITFDQINLNSILEVSATENADGQFIATHIASSSEQDEQQVQGTITNLDSIKTTFTLGALTVDYSQSEIDGELANGAIIEVKATNSPVNNILIADDIDVNEQTTQAGELLDITGIVKALSAQSLTVGQYQLSFNDDTEFTHGEKEELTVGTKVNLIAVTSGDNSAVIKKIQLDELTEIEISGHVELTSDDSFTLAGQNFTVNSFTQYEDDYLNNRQFNFKDITIGDYLEVDAYQVTDGLLSQSIQRKAIETNTLDIDGAVDSFTETTITINKITIATSNLSEFENSAGREITQQQFFEQLNKGQQVEIEAASINGELTAIEIEMESSQLDEIISFEGVIDTFDSSEHFTVNGHSLTTSTHTQYDDGVKSDLILGAQVEIKGRKNNDGVILATAIEFESDASDLEIEGAIDSLTEQSLTVAGNEITINDSTIYEDGLRGDLAIGKYIEVDVAVEASGLLTATNIEFNPQDEDVVVGFITETQGEYQFTIGQQVVTFDAETDFDNGVNTQLAVGLKVKVSGSLDQENILVAEEVEFEQLQQQTVEGAASNFAQGNHFSIGNQQVEVNSHTQYIGGGLSNIDNGVVIKVEGFINVQGSVTAEKVTFEQEQLVKIDGIVSSFTDTTSFSIGTQVIITSAETEFDDDSNSFTLGSNLSIEGYLDNSNVLHATKVSVN